MHPYDKAASEALGGRYAGDYSHTDALFPDLHDEEKGAPVEEKASDEAISIAFSIWLYTMPKHGLTKKRLLENWETVKKYALEIDALCEKRSKR